MNDDGVVDDDDDDEEEDDDDNDGITGFSSVTLSHIQIQIVTT